MKIGIIWQPGALWIGAHWSPYCKRWCINIIPCITIWVMLEGGKVPYSTRPAKSVNPTIRLVNITPHLSMWECSSPNSWIARLFGLGPRLIRYGITEESAYSQWKAVAKRSRIGLFSSGGPATPSF